MKNYYLVLTLSMIFMHNPISNCVAQNATFTSSLNSNNGSLTARTPFKSETFVETGGQFEENKNQWDSKVLYKTDFKGTRVFLEKDRFTYVVYRPSDIKNKHERLSSGRKPDQGEQAVPYYAFRVKFAGANSKVAVSGEQKQKGYHNYYIGNDPSKWASNVGIWSRVNYTELYPGIDLNVYGKDGNLKYDFIVAPRANPGIIEQEYEGVSGISVTNGSLAIKTSLTDVTELKPYCYQWIKGEKKEVACNYVLAGNSIHFNFPEGYNNAFPLIIDPVVVASTYLGTVSSDTWGYCAAYDLSGNIYTGGYSLGPGYPVTNGTFFTGTVDIVISKLNPTGSSLIYATYLGNNGRTIPQSLFVNNNNQLYILGFTDEVGYPVTAGCYDNSYNGGEDLIITKLNTSGNIIASTYIGGTANEGGSYIGLGSPGTGEIIADNTDNPYVVSTTLSSNFPMVNSYDNSYNGGALGEDAVVFKMNSNLSQLTWSTFLGGSDDDAGSGIRLSCNGNVYVAGNTSSTNFPATAIAYRPIYVAAEQDGFVSCLSNNGSSLSASTFFGGHIYFIDLDPADNVYITGTPAWTTSGTQIAVPTTAGVYSNPGSANFITKMNTALSTVMYSTVFGDGSLYDEFTPSAFMVDNCQNVYFSGYAYGYNYRGPLTPNALDVINVGDFYMLKLKKDAGSLLYGSYHGGDHAHSMSRFDKKGILYQAVCDAGFAGFTTTPGAVYPTLLSGSYDIGVFKIDFQTVDSCTACNGAQRPVPAFTSSDTAFCNEGGQCIDFTDHSTGNPTSWQWIFQGATPSSSTAQNPTNICYSNQGTYSVTLIVSNSAGTDTLAVTPLIIYDNPPSQPTITSKGDTLTSSPAAHYQWFLNALPIAGATNQTYICNQQGTYAVQITNSLGCSAFSDGVSCSVGINELSNQEIKIFPNPNSGKFTIYFDKINSIRVFNYLGEIIFKDNNKSNKQKEINLRAVKGIYLIAISDGEKEYQKKLIVE